MGRTGAQRIATLTRRQASERCAVVKPAATMLEEIKLQRDCSLVSAPRQSIAHQIDPPQKSRPIVRRAPYRNSPVGTLSEKPFTFEPAPLLAAPTGTSKVDQICFRLQSFLLMLMTSSRYTTYNEKPRPRSSQPLTATTSQRVHTGVSLSRRREYLNETSFWYPAGASFSFRVGLTGCGRDAGNIFRANSSRACRLLGDYDPRRRSSDAATPRVLESPDG